MTGASFNLIGVVPTTDDAPSFGTPIFRSASSDAEHIQSSNDGRHIHEFVRLPRKLNRERNFLHLRLNSTFQIGDDFVIGFKDIYRVVYVYTKESLCTKLKVEFDAYLKFPFSAFAISKFLGDTDAHEKACQAQEIRAALAAGEIEGLPPKRPTAGEPIPLNEPVFGQWTDERVNLLKKLWYDGLSASQIAEQLGGVKRNAIIGKVHRLGLTSRRIVRDTASGKDMGSQGPAEFIEEPKTSSRKTILELTADSCRWPIGDPGSPDFFFCGANAVLGLPYCAYHSRAVYGHIDAISTSRKTTRPSPKENK